MNECQDFHENCWELDLDIIARESGEPISKSSFFCFLDGQCQDLLAQS